MNQIKFTVVLLTFLLSSKLYSQEMDGYNRIFISSTMNDEFGVKNKIKSVFETKGFKYISGNDNSATSSQGERMSTLFCSYELVLGSSGDGASIRIVFSNAKGDEIMELKGYGQSGLSKKGDVSKALKKALKPIIDMQYNYDPAKTTKIDLPETICSSWTEDSIKCYLKREEINRIEGIYRNIGDGMSKFAILKDSGKFYAIVLDSDDNYWRQGDVKGVFEEINSKYYTTIFYYNNYKKIDAVIEINEDGILKIGHLSYLKVYPKIMK